jgi:hypothetical protein
MHLAHEENECGEQKEADLPSIDFRMNLDFLFFLLFLSLTFVYVYLGFFVIYI